MEQVDADGFADAVAEDQLGWLYHYWQDIVRSKGTIPARTDIRPEEIRPDILPHIGLLDAFSTGRAVDFRFRLVGTAISRIYGHDVVARRPGDLSQPMLRDSLQSMLNTCVRLGAGIYATGCNVYASGFRRPVARLLLPLSQDGEAVDIIMLCAVAEPIRRSMDTASLTGQDIVAIENHDPIRVLPTAQINVGAMAMASGDRVNLSLTAGG